MNLPEILAAHPRVVMIGYPGVGKTALAKEHNDGRLLIHLDDLYQKYGHDETPREALKLLAGVDRYLVEGVQGFRLLRYALRNDLFSGCREPLSCIVLVESKFKPEKKHLALIKGLATIWLEASAFLGDVPVFEIGGSDESCKRNG